MTGNLIMKKLKRILAIVGIVLILSMYVLAFVTAFMKSDNAAALFRGAIACTIIVPVFLYLVMMVARLVSPQKSSEVDAVIIHDAHVLHDEDGRRSWYAEELSGGLKRHGYKVFPLKTADETSMRSILREQHLSPGKTLYLDSDPSAVDLAKSLGCSAYLFSDYADAEADLRKIGVIWTR